MFNVYKNQPSRQTGSRNATGPKTKKCDEKYLERTDRGKTVYPPSGGAGYNQCPILNTNGLLNLS